MPDAKDEPDKVSTEVQLNEANKIDASVKKGTPMKEELDVRRGLIPACEDATKRCVLRAASKRPPINATPQMSHIPPPGGRPPPSPLSVARSLFMTEPFRYDQGNGGLRQDDSKFRPQQMVWWRWRLQRHVSWRIDPHKYARRRTHAHTLPPTSVRS
jgi:hypothetical protein